MTRRTLTKAAARAEAKYTAERHQDILKEIEKRCLTENGVKDGYLYLMALPTIYSTWEGFFKLSCSICLKRKHAVTVKASKFDARYSTLWLQKEPFVVSFFASLVQAMDSTVDPEKKLKPGKFNALSTFSEKLAEWHTKPMPTQPYDKLVMTHSNVNEAVAKVNGDIIGLDLSNIDFGRINELLARRNELSHGGLLSFPNENEVKSLLQYTKDLISGFEQAVQSWITSS